MHSHNYTHTFLIISPVFYGNRHFIGYKLTEAHLSKSKWSSVALRIVSFYKLVIHFASLQHAVFLLSLYFTKAGVFQLLDPGANIGHCKT